MTDTLRRLYSRERLPVWICLHVGVALCLGLWWPILWAINAVVGPGS